MDPLKIYLLKRMDGVPPGEVKSAVVQVAGTKEALSIKPAPDDFSNGWGKTSPQLEAICVGTANEGASPGVLIVEMQS